MRKTIWLLLILAVTLAVPAVPVSAQSPVLPAIEIYTYGNVSPDTVKKYRTTLESALQFYTQEFGELPIKQVTMRLYETSELTVQGLMEFRGVTEEQARRSVATFVGMAVPTNNTFLINLSKRPFVESMVSHELMHLLQGGWGGHSGRSASGFMMPWIAEGMAELYSAKFMDRNGTMKFRDRRQFIIRAAANRWSTLSELPLLSMRDPDWMDALDTVGRVEGYSPVYAYSFLAYEYLEGKTSKAATLAYLADLKTGTGAENAFYSAFKLTFSDLEASIKL